MKKVSDATRSIIEENPFLHFGFYNGLLNLSQTARFIRAQVEARTRKEVSETAVVMSLSRLQKSVTPIQVLPSKLSVDKLSIQSGLCSLTVFKTPRVHDELNRLFAKVRSRNGLITITECAGEITAIIEDDNYHLAESMLTEKMRYVYRNIAAVSIKLTDTTIKSPGSLCQFLQLIALQNINVIEVASSATEFNIYMKSEDVRLAFDTLYQHFSKR